mmetsp:Transcript_37200/g.78949  ORF Transcript_37200/g.78949 Transcript_37200/m.78949 type:complete len:221 (-) Transcript_37200:451-1113(-)
MRESPTRVQSPKSSVPCRSTCMSRTTERSKKLLALSRHSCFHQGCSDKNPRVVLCRCSRCPLPPIGREFQQFRRPGRRKWWSKLSLLASLSLWSLVSPTFVAMGFHHLRGCTEWGPLPLSRLGAFRPGSGYRPRLLRMWQPDKPSPRRVSEAWRPRRAQQSRCSPRGQRTSERPLGCQLGIKASQWRNMPLQPAWNAVISSQQQPPTFPQRMSFVACSRM